MVKKLAPVNRDVQNGFATSKIAFAKQEIQVAEEKNGLRKERRRTIVQILTIEDFDQGCVGNREPRARWRCQSDQIRKSKSENVTGSFNVLPRVFQMAMSYWAIHLDACV